MNLRLFFVILRSRYVLILFTLVVTLATAAVVTISMPKHYTATASVVLNFNDVNPYETSVAPALLSSSYVATQLDVIRSQSVALKVIDFLHMEDDPGLRKAFQAMGPGNGTMRQWLATNLSLNLVVDPSPNSRMVNLSYPSTDRERPAEKAAAIANAFTHAYIATNLELTLEPARRNAVWFDEQIKAMHKRLEDAQARLTAYQQEKGIVALDERLDTETSRLSDLSQSYVKAQAEAYDVKSRQLGQNHPDYVRAITNERSILVALNAQKARILELKKERDEVSSLALDVQNLQGVYDATLKSYSQTSLQSEFNQTNIAILNPASPPQKPDSPNVSLNMAAALFLGLLLGIVLAVVIELLRRRIRSTDDVTELLGTKVLATV